MTTSPNHIAEIGQLHSRELLHEAENERLVRLAQDSRSDRSERFLMRTGDLLMQAGVWLMVWSLARAHLRERHSQLNMGAARS
jgi:type II secretory pathway component PulM